MDSKALIYKKLAQFITKFYTNELIRGCFFFTGLGLLYFLFTSFLEYFLWLKPTGRTFLFFFFIIVEVFLFSRYILFPIFKLFHLQKGLNYVEASKIIGKHFSTVNDTLLNFLQLTQDKNQSELLLASIEQKAQALQPIPFLQAIDFKQNKKYIPLALLPLLIIFILFVLGKQDYISQSIVRVINYDTRYTPPAPFKLVIPSQLITHQNKDFTLQVVANGTIIPDKVRIVLANESYFMQSKGKGVFTYTFEKPVSSTTFHLLANEVTTPNYTLQVIAVPTLETIEMLLTYPSYLHKKKTLIQGTGNATLPEGTLIQWKIKSLATQSILFNSKGVLSYFSPVNNSFFFKKNIVQNTRYQLITSNKLVKNYEKIDYFIQVIKDQYPSIKVSSVPDSLSNGKSYISGQIADDYGFNNLSIFYYPSNRPNHVKRGTIPFKQGVYDSFVFSFPSKLPITPGVTYDYYFQITDNDRLNGYKATKSSVFSHREATLLEKQENYLQQQNDNINGLSKTVQMQQKQQDDLEKIQQISKEKSTIDFKDQQKIESYIKKQIKQESLMKQFSEKIKENIQNFTPTHKDPNKEILEKRIATLDKDFDKNKKLLEELNDLNSKLKQEDLFEKIDKYQQQSKNQSKSLAQLVELTKRYYVEQKAKQLIEKLDKLSQQQESLSTQKDNSAQKQNELNQTFDKLQEELNQLEKENSVLKKPLDIPTNKQKQESITSDMKNASNELNKNNIQKATPKQQNAARKMQQMAQSMSMNMQGGQKEQLQEDIQSLRKIVDNLLKFSFSQEDLIDNFKAINSSTTSISKLIKYQQDLKNQFKHVDDSLFALSLRNPKIAEKITNEIGNVYYYSDKSIDSFTNNQLGKGISSQHYIFTSANTLANLLSLSLNDMQLSMTGMGQGNPKPGKGSGMQLPDIIMRQEELSKKMNQGKTQKTGDGKPSEDGDPKNGQGSKSGKQGKQSGSKEGENSNEGEGQATELLKIIKEQQLLRNALEKELERNGLSIQGKASLEQMKQLEKELLNKGFTQQLQQRALQLKYELLKLKQAAQEQDEDNKREGKTSSIQFNNTAPALPQQLQDYLNSIEILNRQTLPLRSPFNKRIQEYFKKNDKL